MVHYRVYGRTVEDMVSVTNAVVTVPLAVMAEDSVVTEDSAPLSP